MAKTTALTRKDKINNVYSLLKRGQTQIAVALPKHLTPERMIRVAITAIQRTPKLLECTQESLMGAIIEASQLGLETDGIMGQGYLIPFKNTKTGRLECQFMPGYKGLQDLAYRSNRVTGIVARSVYHKDTFDIEYGLNEKLKHIPCLAEDKGEYLGSYAIARIKDGEPIFVYMTFAETEKVKNRSQGANSEYSPWNHPDDHIKMREKTCIRALCKKIPASPEVQKAVSLDEMAEAGIPQELGKTVDLDASLDITKDTAIKITDIKLKADKGPGQPAISPGSEPTTSPEGDSPPIEPGLEDYFNMPDPGGDDIEAAAILTDYDMVSDSKFIKAMGAGKLKDAMGIIEREWKAKNANPSE